MSTKGGVSVYGLGRFPVTLYYEQWVRLLSVAQGLRNFLETNKGELKLGNPTKNDLEQLSPILNQLNPLAATP